MPNGFITTSTSITHKQWQKCQMLFVHSLYDSNMTSFLSLSLSISLSNKKRKTTTNKTIYELKSDEKIAKWYTLKAQRHTKQRERGKKTQEVLCLSSNTKLIKTNLIRHYWFTYSKCKWFVKGKKRKKYKIQIRN